MRALRHEPTWQVVSARLGKECLDKASESKFDLILLDYRLPDMTGLEVLSKLRESNKIPVIMMTSQGSEEVAMKALEAGASAYLVKNHDFGRRLAYEIKEWLAHAGR